jgi:hypothetical protein
VEEQQGAIRREGQTQAGELASAFAFSSPVISKILFDPIEAS